MIKWMMHPVPVPRILVWSMAFAMTMRGLVLALEWLAFAGRWWSP